MKLRLRRDTAKAILSTMPPTPRKRMRAALASLPEDPSGTSAGLDVKQLRTADDPLIFRLRVGDWRAAFIVRDRTVDVVRVFHRGEGYGWLDRRYP